MSGTDEIQTVKGYEKPRSLSEDAWILNGKFVLIVKDLNF